MKIIRESYAYIQKEDLVAIMEHSSSEVPKSIRERAYSMAPFTEKVLYDFVKFEEQEEIDFIRDIDWITDFDEANTLSYDEIIQRGRNLEHEMDSIDEILLPMSEEELKNHQDLNRRGAQLNYESRSLQHYFFYRTGFWKINLPSEIVLENTEAKSKTNEVKGLRKVFRRIVSKINE